MGWGEQGEGRRSRGRAGRLGVVGGRVQAQLQPALLLSQQPPMLTLLPQPAGSAGIVHTHSDSLPPFPPTHTHTWHSERWLETEPGVRGRPAAPAAAAAAEAAQHASLPVCVRPDCTGPRAPLHLLQPTSSQQWSLIAPGTTWPAVTTGDGWCSSSARQPPSRCVPRGSAAAAGWLHGAAAGGQADSMRCALRSPIAA